MIENFIYNDIVLYCKGWYQTPEGDNMLDDLGYLFGEIYGWVPKTEEEIAHFMLRILDYLYLNRIIEHNDNSNNFCKYHNEIKRIMRLNECSVDMANILYVHSILQWLSNDEIKLNRPHYGKKEHFRMGRFFEKYPISMTYKEMNNRAIKAFSD